MSPRFAIGVDVGGTAIKTVLADATGRAVFQREVPTPEGVEALLKAVAKAVAAIEMQVSVGQVSGGDTVVTPVDICRTVGVDVPGIVDESKGIAVLSVNLGWQDVPMAQLLEEALGRPVSLGHDVRSGAWAEARWGAGSDNCMYLALGTGIAAVFIVDGHPVVSGGWAGEIGQALVPDPDHPGQLERFEAVASAGALAKRLADTRAPKDRDDVVAAGALGVQMALEVGDPLAQRVWDTALDAQAEVIARAVCMLGPLDVIIGGGLMKAGEKLLFEPLTERVSKLLTVSPVPRIVPAALGAWAQALGSAGRVLTAEG
ncbi:Glucokinase [Actinomyces bovis]|uniref:Glucokinase n=1 Tax=Actinomyces bovis TaxID=1658 RepID=A0ABY1VNB9_9ACTO|nr:ROK family protein [Actinomyces bovis]SPT52558.1 Glucokinase [Actinomyces bovis]VEG54330.1 Glucokinase [Actinomyces israelii]